MNFYGIWRRVVSKEREIEVPVASAEGARLRRRMVPRGEGSVWDGAARYTVACFLSMH